MVSCLFIHVCMHAYVCMGMCVYICISEVSNVIVFFILETPIWSSETVLRKGCPHQSKGLQTRNLFYIKFVLHNERLIVIMPYCLFQCKAWCNIWCQYIFQVQVFKFNNGWIWRILWDSEDVNIRGLGLLKICTKTDLYDKGKTRTKPHVDRNNVYNIGMHS